MKKPSLLERLRAKKAQRDIAVGVCWYTPEDWERVKATATDADRFENSFADWEAMANESFATICAGYPRAVRVFISADEFLVWCQIRGRINNADARSEFVAELLRKRDST